MRQMAKGNVSTCSGGVVRHSYKPGDTEHITATTKNTIQEKPQTCLSFIHTDISDAYFLYL